MPGSGLDEWLVRLFLGTKNTRFSMSPKLLNPTITGAAVLHVVPMRVHSWAVDQEVLGKRTYRMLVFLHQTP